MENKYSIDGAVCKICGAPTDYNKPYCKICNFKGRFKWIGLTLLVCFLCSAIKTILEMNGILLGFIATILLYAPFFAMIALCKKKFKGNNIDEMPEEMKESYLKRNVE